MTLCHENSTLSIGLGGGAIGAGLGANAKLIYFSF